VDVSLDYAALHRAWIADQRIGDRAFRLLAVTCVGPAGPVDYLALARQLGWTADDYSDALAELVAAGYLPDGGDR
jgi:hypothetical protein